jgi:hypothetical protein
MYVACVRGMRIYDARRYIAPTHVPASKSSVIKLVIHISRDYIRVQALTVFDQANDDGRMHACFALSSLD